MPVTRIDFPLDELTRPQSEEEIQRKLAHERARLASMMGLDSGPVRHFKRRWSGPSPPKSAARSRSCSAA